MTHTAENGTNAEGVGTDPVSRSYRGTPAGQPDPTAVEDVFATLPRIGLYRTEDHQYYFNGFGPLPSVTTVLTVLQKWELAAWREKQIETAAMQWGAWMAEGDAIALVNAARDEAGRFGTSVHILAELLGDDVAVSTGFPIPETLIPYAEAFAGFLGHLRGSGGDIASAEKSVWSPSNGYAGTYDLILQWHCAAHGSCLWLVDIKSSSGYYPDYGLQLAGYANAEYVILMGNPTPYKMPVIDHTAVLHIRPDKYPDTGWRLVEYPTGPRDFLAFLAALELWQWKKEGRFTKSNLQKAMAME